MVNSKSQEGQAAVIFTKIKQYHSIVINRAILKQSGSQFTEKFQQFINFDNASMSLYEISEVLQFNYDEIKKFSAH